MNFSLADLQAFVAAAEQGNFRAAADTLHVSPPALSRRILKLESSLGTQLFERNTHRVMLTLQGREFERRVRPLLHDLQQAVLAINDHASRQVPEVRIACVTSATRHLLADALVAFRKAHPRIRVVICDGTGTAVLEQVRRGRVDFGLSYIFDESLDLDFRPLGVDPFVAICCRSHPLARRKRVQWKELARFEYLSVSRENGNRAFIERSLGASALPPSCEVRHLSSLLGLVESGAGVAAVPRSALPSQFSSLAQVRLIEPEIARSFGTVRRTGVQLPPAAREFDEFLSCWASDAPRLQREKNALTISSAKKTSAKIIGP